MVIPLHPRTRESLSNSATRIGGRIRLIEPVSYLDMLLLEKYARAILTDSGGVQKEVCWAGVSCLALRETTEWVEWGEAVCCRLVGTDSRRIQAALDEMESGPGLPRADLCREVFGDGAACEKIVRKLIGYAICFKGSR